MKYISLIFNLNKYFLLIGDGIYDNLENDEILKMIWRFKKKGTIIDNIHSFSGNIADAIIKYSMQKLSVDNVTVIFIVFKNFEERMKEKNLNIYIEEIIVNL